MLLQWAVLIAPVGAVGCSLLAYILPCLIHFHLTAGTGCRFTRVLDVFIIILAVLASLMVIVVIILKQIHPAFFGPH